MSEKHEADERLRQFLQWRVETGRAPGRRMSGKDVFYTGVVGLVVGTVVASGLITSRAAAPRSPDAGRKTTAVVLAPPVTTDTEPREADHQKSADVEPVPDLPPRSAKPVDKPSGWRPPLPKPPSGASAPAQPVEPSPILDRPVAVDPTTPTRSLPTATPTVRPAPAPIAPLAPATASPPPVDPPAAIRTPPPHPINPPAVVQALPPQPVNPPAVVRTPPPAPLREPSVARTRAVESPRPAPSARALAPPPSAPAPADSRLETLKRLAGYIPEVWLARKVAGWVKTQPPPDGTPPPAPEVIQAR